MTEIRKLLRNFFLLVGVITILLLNPSRSLANSYSDPFTGCFADPINSNPGQEVKLTIQTKDATNLWPVVIKVENTVTHEIQTINVPAESQKQTTRTISIGTFNQAGSYSISAAATYGQGAPPDLVGKTAGACRLDAAFSINGASSDYPNFKVEAPPPSFPRGNPPITKLSSIIISGLTPGKAYNIKLPNWKAGGKTGADLTSSSNGKVWTADGSGKISASNICNNGEASRTDCTEEFGAQVYDINVFELIKTQIYNAPAIVYKEGSLVGSYSFEILKEQGEADTNPCADPKTKIVTACPTALGNIPTNPTEFIKTILGIAIGLAGGIALIFMIMGAIKVLTSSGDQKKLAEGKDQIVAALSGLLLLIFSVLILRFMGTTLLGGIAGI